MSNKEKMLELSDEDANRLFGKDVFKLDSIERNNAAAALRKGFTDSEAAYHSTNPAGKLRPDPDAKQKPVKKAKGGYVRSADGCAQRGKTKGRMV